MVALRSVGLTQEIVVISVLHEAPELLVYPRLLGVSHGEVLVLAHHPVTQTRKLDDLVLGPLHALAVFEGDIELLI